MPKRIDETSQKKCTKCGCVKPASDFGVGSLRRDGTRGLAGSCKKCRVIETRKYHERNPDIRRASVIRSTARRKIDRKENLRERTLSAIWRGRALAISGNFLPCNSPIDEIMSSFTGYCHVCGVPEIECKHRLAMDHDHSTGKFRGWLCHKCNQAAGLLKESPEVIIALAEYVDQGGLYERR